MTPQQLATLKAAILADPQLSSQPMTSGGAAAIALVLNAPASPDWYVWRTNVTRVELQDMDAFNWTVVDNLATGSKFRIWEWMFQETGAINPAKANIRSGIAACWVGNAALLAVQTAILGACKRTATVAEKLFSTGTGSLAAPATMGFEGALSSDDVQQARELP